MDLSIYATMADDVAKNNKEKIEKIKKVAQGAAKLNYQKINKLSKISAQEIFDTIEQRAKQTAMKGLREFQLLRYSGIEYYHIKDEIIGNYCSECVDCLTRKHLTKLLIKSKISYVFKFGECYDDGCEGCAPSCVKWVELLINF